jgi:hypothetical protein
MEYGNIREIHVYLSIYNKKVYETLNLTSVCIVVDNSEHKEILEVK